MKRILEKASGWVGGNTGLLLLFAVALAVRMIGIDFGLPDQLHADEIHIVSRAIKFGSGDLNPHFFYYPAFLMYLMFGFFACWFVVGHIIGVFATAADFGMQYFIDPSSFYLIARTVVAVFGAATVCVVAAYGRRFFSRGAGTAAALMLALAPMHVENSHFATTDVAMTFFIMLSLYFAARASEDGARRDYVFAGIAAGLAMATKYTAMLLAPALLLAHLMAVSKKRKSGGKASFVSSDAFLMFLLFAAVFLICAPYTLLDYKTFIGDLRIQNVLLTEGWLGNEKPVNMWIHSITGYLADGLGSPLLVAALAGVVFLAVARKPAGLILVVFFLTYYVFIARYSMFGYQRHWLGVVPVLCLAGAVVVDALAGVMKKDDRWRHEVSGMLAVAVMIPSAVQVVRADRRLMLPDTRTVAREWIERNAPAGAFIAVEYGGPQIKPTIDSLMNTARRERFAADRVEAVSPYFAYSKRKPVKEEVESRKTFHTAALEKIPKKYEIIDSFTLADFPMSTYCREKVDYIAVSSQIYDRYFAAADKYPEAVAFYRQLDEHAMLVMRFEPIPGVRTGPAIKLYRLNPLPCRDFDKGK